METKNCETGYCDNFTLTCPNVKPYKDGSKRTLHSETKCIICGKRWTWGLSWNGSKDGQFHCGCELVLGDQVDLEIKSIKEQNI